MHRQPVAGIEKQFTGASMKLSRTYLRHTPKLAALAPLLALLAGCQGTLDTRPAQVGDTPDAWSSRLATLPVEVHDLRPGARPASALAAQVERGTTAAQFAAAHPLSPPLQDQPRVVMYVSTGALASPATLCQAPASTQTPVTTADATTLSAAICDGPRLVDRLVRTSSARALDAGHAAGTAVHLENQLVWALSDRENQPFTADVR